MAKLTAVARYILMSFLTIIDLIAITWALLPVEWSPHLFRLLSRSFGAFAQSLGNNSTGWLVSNVYAQLFLIIVPVVLVGVVRGVPPMRHHWETTKISLMALASLIAVFYGFIYLRTVVSIVYNEHQSAISEHSRLTKDVQNLTRELSTWKTSRAAENHRAKSTSISGRGSQTISQQARTVASDVLDFQANKLVNSPVIVLSGPAPELTRRTVDDSNRYNQQAVVDLLKRFGGPIESIMREVRPYGIDTSRLQRHIEELNSIQMMRLIADDVNDIADQLNPGDLLSSNSRTRMHEIRK
jgi:hypothetical protein